METDNFFIGEGQYQAQTFLGAGETGMVYQGKRVEDDLDVAIKIIKPELTRNGKFVHQLFKELEHISNYKHNNIVQVYDWGQEAGNSYIVMEFVDGKSLDKILQERGILTVNAGVAILMQLAIVLDYAHRQSLIHRSVNPTNVLISKDKVVKISDFGVSKAAATAWITITGTFQHNLEYMSPEQAEGEEVDYRSDLYSLGILAYQMLTGNVPFPQKKLSILELAMMHINQQPKPPSALNSEIPNWLEAIILRLLEKKPEKRLQTGLDVYKAIENKGIVIDDENNDSIYDKSESSFRENIISINDKTTEIKKSDTTPPVKITSPEPIKLPESSHEVHPQIVKEVSHPQAVNEFTNSQAVKEINKPPASNHEEEVASITNNISEVTKTTKKNNTQLKLLLAVVIVLELIIISIFAYIYFS